MAKRRAPKPSRTEHDLLGSKRVPGDARYGIQTQRGLENFHISGVPVSHYPDFVRGLAMVKQAAARANADVGAMPRKIQRAIDAACKQLIDGKWHDQFPVDMFQGGAGTSTNMNANEVIANVALEIMGRPLGD